MANVPGVVDYPAALDSAVTLFIAKNSADTVLTASMTSGDTSATVASTGEFGSSGVIVIDNEIIFYTSKDATHFNGLIRGSEASAAAAHSNGATVFGRATARQRDVLKDAIIAIETEIGAAPSGSFTDLVDRLANGFFKPDIHTHVVGSQEGPISHNDLANRGANDHHSMVHTLAGNNHTGLLDVAQLPITVPQIVAVKTADEIVNNSNTLQNDDHLFFPMVANSCYVVEGMLWFTSLSQASDYKLGLTVPAGASGVWGHRDATSASQPAWGALGSGSTTVNGVVALTSTLNAASDAKDIGIGFRAIVRVGGTAGNFQLQWAQNAVTAENSVLRADSHLKAYRVR